MRNIGRPFTLYSDFLPSGKESRKWQYLAFGYFDGVNVGDNLFEDGEWNFEKMWQHSEKEKDILDGSYTEQTVFGFRTEEEEDESDEKFWNSVGHNQYPFLFFVLLQVEFHEENLSELCKERNRLERDLSVNEGVIAVSYLTLDSSDLLLVLACKEYSMGAGLIDSFHTGKGSSVLCDNGWNLCYSYTVSAIKKSFLNDTDKVDTLKEMLDSVYIHVIEKHPGSIERVYQDIVDQCPKEIEKKAVLGCNDDLIIIKEVPWNFFLKLYQDNVGVLNHSCSIYQKNIIGVTTIIGGKEDKRVIKEGKSNSNCYTMSGELRRECRLLRLDHDSSRGRVVRKELLSVLNSLEKYEKAPFHDYIFLSALQPMKMLIEMVKEADKEENADKYGFFYDFLTSFNMYTQNSVRSDRQFTEVPDFNIRIYDIPAKMNALYNAVIYDLKSLLNGFGGNEKRHEYEFLTCPGVANDMQVREVYPELIEDKRLFLVDMPEKQVYSPKLMFIMLTHEISHFVGRKIRRRDFRYKCMVRMVSDIITAYFYQKLVRYIGDQNHFDKITQTDDGISYWQVLRDQVAKQMECYMEWESKDEFMDVRYKKESLDEEAREWWRKRLELYGDHSDMLISLMVDHLCRVCQEQDLYSYVLMREYLYQLQQNGRRETARIEKEKLKTSFEKWSWEFCEVSDWNPCDWGARSIMNNLMYLLKECFADLGAVMILKLSVKEYLEAILFSARDQGMTVDILIRQRADMVRGALVCLCMVNDEDSCPQKWTFDEVFDMIEKEGDTAKLATALWREMCIYQEDYYKEPWEMEIEKNILYSGCVLESALCYLVECRKNYESHLTENMQQIRKRILNMFDIFSEKSVEHVIAAIREYIDIYQQKLAKELIRCKGKTEEGTKDNA